MISICPYRWTSTRRSTTLPWAQQNPGACWTKFGTPETEYTKGTQAQFDVGPQSEDDFESGKTSEDYMMKLLQYMWT
ncbi:unnamed protein product, partial [Pylaiella littoralis]